MLVISASVHDRDDGRSVIEELVERFPSVRHIWADGGYAGKADGGYVGKLVDWARESFGVAVEIVNKIEGQRGFTVPARRWSNARSLGSPSVGGSRVAAGGASLTPRRGSSERCSGSWSDAWPESEAVTSRPTTGRERQLLNAFLVNAPRTGDSSGRAAASREWLDVLEDAGEAVAFDLEFVASLKIEPEPLARSEVLGETQGGVGAHATLAVNDLVDPPRRDPDSDRQAVLGDT